MTRGDPRFSVRLPAPIIQALKQLAESRHTTPSYILRNLALNELKRAGYSVEPKGGGKTIA